MSAIACAAALSAFAGGMLARAIQPVESPQAPGESMAAGEGSVIAYAAQDADGRHGEKTVRNSQPQIWAIDTDGKSRRSLIPNVGFVWARVSWQPVPR